MRGHCIIISAVLALASASPVGAVDLLVTQYKNDPSGAPYGVALEKGFFKNHGLDITGIVSGAGGGSSVRNAMASDLGYGDVTAAPVIAAAEQGQDVKIVGITSRSLADLVLIVMPDSPIKTPADLKGKKFGISNPKSLGEMMGVLVMEKAGLKQGDVQMTALGSLSGPRREDFAKNAVGPGGEARDLAAHAFRSEPAGIFRKSQEETRSISIRHQSWVRRWTWSTRSIPNARMKASRAASIRGSSLAT